MSKKVNVPTVAQFDFTQLQKTIPLPRRESARLLRLALCDQFTLASGSASGTVGGAAPAPLQPLGLIRGLKISKNPAGMQGTLNFAKEQLALLQNIVIPFKNRVAARTAPSSGAAASYEIYAEMMLPYSLPEDGDLTAQPMGDAESWEVEVSTQPDAATARDAVYTTNDRTFTYHTSSPVKLQASVEFADRLPGGPLMEIACSLDRFVIDSTQKSFEVKSVSPGEVPLLHVIQNWDNNIRAVLPGGNNSFISASFGAGEAYYESRPSENVQDSASLYAIRDGDMPTGAYFIDPVSVFGGVHKVPVVGQSGGTPNIRLNLGSAVTGTAFMDVLTVRGRWTAKGLAWLAARK